MVDLYSTFNSVISLVTDAAAYCAIYLDHMKCFIVRRSCYVYFSVCLPTCLCVIYALQTLPAVVDLDDSDSYTD